MAGLTPQQFVKNWAGTTLTERSSYQFHFADLCDMVDHARPDGSGTDAEGLVFVSEHGLKKDTGGQGFADVFYENHFAIEYKGAGKYDNLDEALNQLKQYRENLKNPPLLIVTDIATWEIHTNFTNAANRSYEFTHEEITQPHVLRWLRNIFTDPNQLHPNRTAAQVTAEAADVFKRIADTMRSWEADPERIAHFMTKLVFCLFAEDTGLLPVGSSGDGVFTEVISRTRNNPEMFTRNMQGLFESMAEGGSFYVYDIPYFNGSLFEDIAVERLESDALNQLELACRLDWAKIEPAIFGTLFERSLDPSKRAQLGAHYTSREDILLIVEPVLMQPLRRAWDETLQQAQAVRAKYDAADSKRSQTTFRNQLNDLREEMLDQVGSVRVLDPACGSGNFLYVSLGLLLDLEKEIITDPVWADVGLTTPLRRVHPRQLFGIEVNVIAHALSSIVVWIGYIQWMRDNGYDDRREPILEDLHGNIQLMDAIMTSPPSPLSKGGEGEAESGGAQEWQVREPDWPQVDVIVGNPPFLGAKKMKGELGEAYVDTLHGLYSGRLPGFSDLVTYWFEKARAQIEQGKAARAGLLATNSIGMGTNLTVLQRIKETGDIFMAWSDREWILDGAAVRVAMIGFDDGAEDEHILDGIPVTQIHSNLTATVDITQAKGLEESAGIAFIGTQKSGPFDIDSSQAKKFWESHNASGRQNADIVVPWVNGLDIVRRSRDMYIIDFPADFTEEQASEYEEPFRYVVENVKPKRTAKHFETYPYWIHWNPRPAMRQAMLGLSRFMGTARVAKHRVFVWLPINTNPDSQVVAIARDDDYFFGVLHSKLHEVWSLRMGTWLGKGNDPRYTPTTTFETFPFPWSPGSEDTASAAYAAISAAAKQLHEERDAWLNPPEDAMVLGELRDRTLTNLYNALVALREMGGSQRDMPGNIKSDAWDFAPRLRELHDALDAAVCDAYGWPHDVLDDEEEILRRLLELNLARAG